MLLLRITYSGETHVVQTVAINRLVTEDESIGMHHILQRLQDSYESLARGTAWLRLRGKQAVRLHFAVIQPKDLHL